MRVNIVCSQPSWIYGTFIEYLQRYSRHEIRVNENELPCSTVHFLPYYEVPETLPDGIKYTAFFSHQEVDHQDRSLNQKFISASKIVDASICMAKKYVSVLQEAGAKRVVQIMPGVDTSFFYRGTTPLVSRSLIARADEKLVVGFVGKLYDTTDRKNSNLLFEIANLPFVDFRATLGAVAQADLPKFYSELDLVISPSTVEGGPMCIIEALSVGVPILCFSGVGFADEFEDGVLRVPLGDEAAFLERLKVFFSSGEKELYRSSEMVRSMQLQIKELTWESFVRKHDLIWEEL